MVTKPQLVEGESIIDITKPVNVVEIEEESPCGREEEVAELVDEHPAPVRPVGAGTSAIMVEVSDPDDLLLMLSTPLHSAAVATDVKLADNA